MKKLLVFTALIGSTCFAGGISEIALMAEDDVRDVLALNLEPFNFYQIREQKFVPASEPTNLAIETRLLVIYAEGDRKQEWTCVTQFAKTPEFFKVLKTSCLN